MALLKTRNGWSLTACLWYEDIVGNTVQENFPNQNMLIAVSKGVLAVKLLQYIDWGSQLTQLDLHNDYKMFVCAYVCLRPVVQYWMSDLIMCINTTLPVDDIVNSGMCL